MSREKFHLKHRWKGKALQSWKRYIQQHEFSESVTETMTETHGTVSSPDDITITKEETVADYQKKHSRSGLRML